MVALFKKRVYDLAGCSPASVNVYLNNKKIPGIKNFANYVNLYFKGTKEPESQPVMHQETRWEVGVSLSDSGTFQQVSFVNSICTTRGGTHCNYIADQIIKKCTEIINKKHKALNIKPGQIKNSLFLFVNCLIENPAFDSQTKETLTTHKERFGSKCELSEAFLKKVVNCGIIKSVVDLA